VSMHSEMGHRSWLLRSRQSRPASRQSGTFCVSERSIVVTGSKGGVGTTTVALNLAVHIARMTKKRIALLEFARPFGQIARMLDAKPRFTLLDALAHAARLDQARCPA